MNKCKNMLMYRENGQWIYWGILFFLCLGSLIFVNYNYSFYDRPIAQVIEISDERQVEVTDGSQNHDTVYTQSLVATIKNGEEKGQQLELTNEYSDSRAYHPKLSKGDDVFVSIEQTNTDKLVGSMLDMKRDQALLIVAWIFIFVLLAVGRKQGLFAMISLVVNALIIAYALELYIDTSNISLLFIMSGAVIVMTILSLLFVSGFQEQTYAAIISTLLGTFMLLFITVLVLWLTDEQGLRFEEMAFLSRPPQAIFMAGVLVGALGAVMDIGVSMASSLFSLYEKNNEISIKDLRESGIEIGKDIMGTMTNILFFAYVSGTIPSLLLYLMNDASLGFTLSMNLSLELTRALAGGIGIVLTIPIGLYTTILFIHRKQVKS
ncbi:YibE/F-like protein [Paraliobacillus sp. PM-2]|uniref:YibE/F family protein n=1 Tax=Paraliobacillus sp. PM-2 TaxID=1462524 RepID=UPI00061C87B3|nr:YibE/F family protein [Paraliobacillus sp. PM-2]CQR45970.1 YibE/F-like protein [Paraliobacillus sp. PM-2]